MRASIATVTRKIRVHGGMWKDMSMGMRMGGMDMSMSMDMSMDMSMGMGGMAGVCCLPSKTTIPRKGGDWHCLRLF